MSDAKSPKETPVIAGPLVRLAAFMYDGLLLMALWFILGVVFVAINGGEGVQQGNPFFRSAVFLIWVWFNLYFWRRGGQTLGMRAWRLQLQSTTGKPLSLMQGMIRLIVAVPAFALAGVGYFWAWIDKDKLTWHDRYSETRVVRLPKEEKKK